MTKWALFQESKNGSTYENNTSISVDADKAFDKILHSFMIKTRKLEIGGHDINIIKATLENPAANVIVKV